MTDLLLDPISGIAGDMFVGALLDLGASFEALEQGLASLGLDGVTVSQEPADRGPLRATWFRVDLGPHADAHPHRTLADVRAILARGDLPERVRARADRAFCVLAEAEAKVHGKTRETIHFHEVGALDAICDVVGVALLLEQLDVDRVFVGSLPLGRGHVETQHGRLPIPAPATLECLAGFDVRFDGPEMELVTPTGAALVAALCEGPGKPSELRVRRIGYGAGSRDRAEFPNVLRAVLLESTTSDRLSDAVIELATNLDHVAPTILSSVGQQLLSAGALDVTLTAVTMKKGRPGHVLTVLAPHGRADALTTLIFRATGTLGVRRRPVTRLVLERASHRVETPFGPVSVKTGRFGGEVTSAVPEFEECQDLANRCAVPVSRVIEAAQAAFAASSTNLPSPGDPDSTSEDVPS